jgi:hypothetical protein
MNDEIVKLDEKQLEKFSILLSVVRKQVTSKEIKLLHRGDALSTVKDKLNTNDLNILSSRIYTLGEKANSLFLTSTNRSRFIFRIDNVENQVFSFIFDSINSILEIKKNEIFIESISNIDFCNFFKNKNNRDIFIKEIKSSDKKIFIKDYYMAFLHTTSKKFEIPDNVSNSEFYNRTYFLSTSTEEEIAEKFARKNEDNVVFYCYVTQPYISFGVDLNNQFCIKEEINKYNLPTYNPIFKNQYEFSIRGGLLPHYILCTKICNTDEKIIVNPYIFSEEFIESKLGDGIPVNQENFIKILKETNYKGHFEETNGVIRQEFHRN